VRASGSLWSQSGAFWAGAGLVAESVLLLLLWIFVEPGPDALDYFFARPWWIIVFIVASALMVLAVAWAAHRLGLGD
jgi:hypothetical protein